ncbi:complex III assembly factor LYRM7 [Colletes gigas]|uniref:complex III assembly factor LYRM7 n=1 Tax=Colletes gigas TaxID=935657 RepID=UPI001C9B74E6|nr:complex III assembly factor LYRM7 [Colletes gigas]XP_043265969.1 complex III assembly factor LYRM7 [Colletes gigas]
MGDNLRREVLHMFKKLHRTRMNIFRGDEHALKVTRNSINEEYKKYKNVTNTAAIEELNKFAQEVEHEVRTTVVQAVETKPGNFALRITPDTKLLDNIPFEDSDTTQDLKRPPPKNRPQNSN